MAQLVPRWEVPIGARVAWVVTLGLLAAVTGVAQVLDRKLKSTTWEWIHEPTLQVGLVVALSLATFLDMTRRAVHRLGAGSVARKSKRINQTLSTLVVSIAEITETPVRDLGCGLYLIRGRGIRRLRELVRVERVRLMDDLFPSEVDFTIGKGTVGLCWQNQRKEHSDWRAVNAKYATAPVSDEQWAKMRDDVKRGFTRKEWVSIVGKYAEVLAMPVMVDGKFQGCVAVDRKWSTGSASSPCILDDEVVTTPVGAYARTLEAILGK